MHEHVPARRTRLAPWLTALLHELRLPAADLCRVGTDANHSNDIHELTFGNGRVLLLKAARHPWGAAFFDNAAAAAERIRAHSDVVVPRPLPLPASVTTMPVQAYWRVELPTLAQLWPRLARAARCDALHTLGALLRRLHAVVPPAWGPLNGAAEGTRAAALDRDLRQRLLPATIAHWPEGISPLEQLIAGIPELPPRVTPALVHGDLHLGNVLCRVDRTGVECVGFLDLDGAAGGMPEADIANLDVLHGTLFEREVDAGTLAAVRAGYAAPLDEHAVHYYGCVHLANQGFTSALLGHDAHATAIRAELEARLGAIAPLSGV